MSGGGVSLASDFCKKNMTAQHKKYPTNFLVNINFHSETYLFTFP